VVDRIDEHGEVKSDVEAHEFLTVRAVASTALSFKSIS
jgi:hypothetical protein